MIYEPNQKDDFFILVFENVGYRMNIYLDFED